MCSNRVVTTRGILAFQLQGLYARFSHVSSLTEKEPRCRIAYFCPWKRSHYHRTDYKGVMCIFGGKM